MVNFYKVRQYKECEADEFCVCTVCMFNKSNEGSCNTCCNCVCGNKLEDSEVSCFVAMKSMLSMAR